MIPHLTWTPERGSNATWQGRLKNFIAILVVGAINLVVYLGILIGFIAAVTHVIKLVWRDEMSSDHVITLIGAHVPALDGLSQTERYRWLTDRFGEADHVDFYKGEVDRIYVS